MRMPITDGLSVRPLFSLTQLFVETSYWISLCLYFLICELWIIQMVSQRSLCGMETRGENFSQVLLEKQLASSTTEL